MRSKPADAWQRDAFAVAQALFAAPRGDPPDARIEWLIDDLAHLLEHVGGRSRFVFRAALKAVTLAGPAAVFAARAFHALPLEQRVEALTRLEHGPLGMAVFAVKTLLCFLWYEHPDSAVEAGLVPEAGASMRPPGPRIAP